MSEDNVEYRAAINFNINPNDPNLRRIVRDVVHEVLSSSPTGMRLDYLRDEAFGGNPNIPYTNYMHQAITASQRYATDHTIKESPEQNERRETLWHIRKIQDEEARKTRINLKMFNEAEKEREFIESAKQGAYDHLYENMVLSPAARKHLEKLRRQSDAEDLQQQREVIDRIQQEADAKQGAYDHLYNTMSGKGGRKKVTYSEGGGLYGNDADARREFKGLIRRLRQKGAHPPPSGAMFGDHDHSISGQAFSGRTSGLHRRAWYPQQGEFSMPSQGTPPFIRNRRPPVQQIQQTMSKIEQLTQNIQRITQGMGLAGRFMQSPFGAGMLRFGAAAGPIGAGIAVAAITDQVIRQLIDTLSQKGYPLNRDWYRVADEHMYGLLTVEEERQRFYGRDMVVATQTDRYEAESGSTSVNSLENRDAVILSKVGLAERALGVDYIGS